MVAAVVNLASRYHTTIRTLSMNSQGMSSRTYLPIELVLNVITCSVPHAADTILDVDHPTTKLLLAFTLVCRQTSSLAKRYLRQHCVYLDSETSLEYYLQASPAQLALRHITSMSLAPFELKYHSTYICDLVRKLLRCVCDTLKVLVMDMSLQFDNARDEGRGILVLGEGLKSLTNLEEFVSIQDDADLDIMHDERDFVWREWKKLKRLALGTVDYVDAYFWEQVALHPSLETLFVAGVRVTSGCDPKVEYLKHTTRSLRFVILDSTTYLARLSDYVWQSDRESVDPTNIMAVSQYLVPYWLEVGSVRSAGEQRQLLIKRAAEDGSLWTWDGNAIVQPQREGA